MAKFVPKFVGPFKVLEVVNNNVIIDVAGEKTTVNLDQIRVYKFRNDNETSQMSSGESQLLWSRKSFSLSF